MVRTQAMGVRPAVRRITLAQLMMPAYLFQFRRQISLHSYNEMRDRYNALD